MSTKTNPSKISDCYANAAPDEPMFVLLARDPDAQQLVELWAKRRRERGEDPAKVEEALKCARDMQIWRMKNRPTPEFARLRDLSTFLNSCKARTYAGIGSREVEKMPDMKLLVTSIAARLDKLGWTLRSGRAGAVQS